MLGARGPRAALRPKRENSMADFRPERIDFGSDRIDFGPKWADFGPES